MSIYDKYLNNFQDTNLLRKFALIGSREKFDAKLHYLSMLAEPENWDYNFENISVLFYYVVHTFDRCYKQEKIVIHPNEELAMFNTGLMTTQGNEIFGVFRKSLYYNSRDRSSNYWFLSTFIKDSDRMFTDSGLDSPPMATYFEDYNELYFDPNKEIRYDFDHIYDDNRDRLPETFQKLPKEHAKIVFDGFLSHTIKKIKRNARIPVPQFYRDEIMFLIPVESLGNELIVLALEKGENHYRANTILTLGMAYNCARLLTKPESNWLLLNNTP